MKMNKQTNPKKARWLKPKNLKLRTVAELWHKTESARIKYHNCNAAARFCGTKARPDLEAKRLRLANEMFLWMDIWRWTNGRSLNPKPKSKSKVKSKVKSK